MGKLKNNKWEIHLTPFNAPSQVILNGKDISNTIMEIHIDAAANEATIVTAVYVNNEIEITAEEQQ